MAIPQTYGAYSPPRSREIDGRTVLAAVSLAAGALVALGGLTRRTLPGFLMTGLGGVLLFRGASHGPGLRRLLGRTGEAGEIQEEIDARGIEVSQNFLVNRSASDVYAYWRDFGRLPQIMTYLEDVRVMDDRCSHWVAKAPLLAGGHVEWDAEITRDEPPHVIGWRSLPGSQVEMEGEIRFKPALGDRGTEVHVSLSYVPPAGRLGDLLAKMFGKAPRRTIREDLRNFKRIMEVGEVLTTTGQSRGTCLRRQS